MGSIERLRGLAEERAAAYERMADVARHRNADAHSKMVSMALVAAIEDDAELGRRAVDMALVYVDGPIRQGHVPFGADLARSALVYDLCYAWWTEEERDRFHTYLNETARANQNSETHVFHNGWYAYKYWGIGLAAYASYYDNRQAPELIRNLEEEFINRAAPALELAGAGGGWAEGYYINYWLYEWLFFCEAARFSQGVDYYAMAPAFFGQRAIASMFEAYPGIGEYGSRRSVSMGDGGGRTFGGDRDKALSARRILVNYHRDDPAHQAVHVFNESTPRSSVGNYAYKDFLWRDTTVAQGDLADFKLSHYSSGPGYIYGRSDWSEVATHFFFKAGDRFTAHQHLDVGHFLIYRSGELAGDGGHYDSFNSPHAVNYYLRSIAHNTVLVYDPEEEWPTVRAGEVTGNDGGQAHNWPHHNGAVTDAAAWERDRDLYDIADMLAYEDHGDYLYLAADCSRAYSADKLVSFTRQIIFQRPGTFVILDRVEARHAELRKTWLLQAAKRPMQRDGRLVVNNGDGQLFVQTLLPQEHRVRLVDGADLYRYGGRDYAPERDTGPAPECRVEVRPAAPAAVDYFLHVLTATDAGVESVPEARGRLLDGRVEVELDGKRLVLPVDPRQGTGHKVETAVAPGGDTGTTAAFELEQNFPNPFNAGTDIHFSLPAGQEASLTVYDLVGQQVAELVRGRWLQGVHRVAGTAATRTAVRWPVVSIYTACRRGSTARRGSWRWCGKVLEKCLC
ncbi:MAG: hypothetical protein GKR89_35655 [Candidatus Latescibacteria bacterium]|nr:hypothetical protein [Candidatus Latescibacterota bacterium]